MWTIPCHSTPLLARLGERRPDQAADQRVRGRGREAEPPREQVPDDRAEHCGEHGLLRREAGVDDPLADRLRDSRRRERARRGSRPPRSRRRAAARARGSRSSVATAFAVSWKPFVKSNASANDDRDDEQRHRFLTRIASSTSAAFSQASTASSICSWMSFQRMIVSGSWPERKSRRPPRAGAGRPRPRARGARTSWRLRVAEALEQLDRLVQVGGRAVDDLRLLDAPAPERRAPRRRRCCRRPRRRSRRCRRSPMASRYMSSRSNGVTNVRFRRLITSWVSRSPSCSASRMSRSSRGCSGQPSSSSTSSRAIVAAFADGLGEEIEELALLRGQPEARHRRGFYQIVTATRNARSAQETAK